MTMPDSITDVIFDLGKVLVPFDWEIAFSRLTGRVPAEVARWITHDRQTFIDRITGPVIDMERGLITFSEFHSLIRDIILLDASIDEFRDIWCDIFWLDEDVVEIGTELAKRYPCWLMSNTNRAHYEWIISRFPSVRFYRQAALSYKLGFMKPERAYYEKALQLFDVNPQRAVFIDDIQENLDGAAVFGIRTIRFENAKSLIRGLNDIGVIA